MASTFVSALFVIAAVFSCAADSAAVVEKYEGLTYIGSMESVKSDGHLTATNYYVSVNKATWKEAEEWCGPHTNGGHLLAIETAAEDRLIHNRLISSGENKLGEQVWTSGYYNQVTTDWHWFSTQTAFTDYRNWKLPEEPIENSPTARVAFRSRDLDQFSWNVIHDQEQRYFICEKTIE